ncbi:DUF6429 family protein [Caballeronia sp. AZ7_KS35]|uniref:DUF6429 family protein n=1 Tax=Caballeronia sp. AZ7_KS35 TaxID=2921762 RepID=UPI0020285B7D
MLALLYLNVCGGNRASKSFDWSALNRLQEKGFIRDPVSRSKSVGPTEEGLREAERLFQTYFGRSPTLESDAKPT